MTDKIKKFSHPTLDSYGMVYGEKALEINEIITEEFKWANRYGYKQKENFPEFSNREKTVFYKIVDSYKFYFDVRHLKLNLCFIYNMSDTLLEFNGDGEYDNCIELNYSFDIINSYDIEILENNLIVLFKNELKKLFWK